MKEASKPIRWWPLWIILILAVLGTLAIRILLPEQRDNQVFLTALIILLTFVLSILWLLFFSRLRWQRKLSGLAVIILGLFFMSWLFPFKGVKGDLVPVFEWRWTKEPTTFRQAADSAPTPETSATDYPQFLGQNRNGVVTGIQLETDWEATPPELIWRQPIGAGWSGFAVVGNAAITQEQDGDWEKVVCYELTTGEIKWSHQDEARYYTAPGGLGPRSTPTISGNRVYTVGSTGILNCLDFETGDQLWTTNMFEENGAVPPEWGVSISPLILGDLVIVSAGGPVAYHKDTGEIAWTGHRTKSGYSSPLLTTLAGTEQLVFFNEGLITAHEPMSGDLLWKRPWAPEVYTACVSQPIRLTEDEILFSTGYGVGAKRLQISRNSAGEFDVSVIWETIYLKAKFTNIIYYEGYLYGLDDGIFTCVDPVDGKRQWKRGRYGHGQTIRVSDVLLVVTESGEVVLIDPDPQEHIEHSRFEALQGKTWNTPALAGDYLLVRNGREAACYRLPTLNSSIE